MTFRKLLNEDQFERPSDQVVLEPNFMRTNAIFAVGSSNDLERHVARDYATFWLGLQTFTPPPTPPPSPPPSPPKSPPPLPPPLPPLPLPPAPPPAPPPNVCPGGTAVSSLDPEFACEFDPLAGLTMHWKFEKFWIPTTSTFEHYVKVRLICDDMKWVRAGNNNGYWRGWFALGIATAPGQVVGATALVAVPSWRKEHVENYAVQRDWGLGIYSLGVGGWTSATAIPRDASDVGSGLQRPWGWGTCEASRPPKLSLMVKLKESGGPFDLTAEAPVHLLFAKGADIDSSASTAGCSPMCPLVLSSHQAQSSFTLDLSYDGRNAPRAPPAPPSPPPASPSPPPPSPSPPPPSPLPPPL